MRFKDLWHSTPTGTWNRRRLDPRTAYTLLINFLNNPCPNIIRQILHRRAEIAAIAREYRIRLAHSGYAPGYAEGAELFLRAFEQVEFALVQLGYRESDAVDDVTYQGIRVVRPDRC